MLRLRAAPLCTFGLGLGDLLQLVLPANGGFEPGEHAKHVQECAVRRGGGVDIDPKMIDCLNGSLQQPSESVASQFTVYQGPEVYTPLCSKAI